MALFDEIFRNLQDQPCAKSSAAGSSPATGKNNRPAPLDPPVDPAGRRNYANTHQAAQAPETKLVLMADVSGSMDIYSRFLIKFTYGLQKYLRDTETFAFGTQLMRIQRHPRQPNAGIGHEHSVETGGTRLAARTSAAALPSSTGTTAASSASATAYW